MSEGYAPTTDVVADRYAMTSTATTAGRYAEHRAEFDRWLAKTIATETEALRAERDNGFLERDAIIEHLRGQVDDLRTEVAQMSTDVTFWQNGTEAAEAKIAAVEALLVEDGRDTGREVSCGGYPVNSDGCFAADLANRITAALSDGPRP